MEPGESQEECVLREVREETHLEVQIERLLFETKDPDKQYTYHRYVTYLCTPVSGEAAAGTEGGDSPLHSITEVGWYPIWDERQWEPGFYEEHIYPLLRSIQAALRIDL